MSEPTVATAAEPKPPHKRSTAAKNSSPNGTPRPARPAAKTAVSGQPARTGRVEATLRAPLVSASIRLPGPGAVARVGPVRFTLPPGALYYAGVAALVAGGAVELPVAAGIALVGTLLGRGRLGGLRPSFSLFDSDPDPGRGSPAER
ncbi:MAG TPA: hypothetical protein VHV82_15545 [Sporichthyaceae bacterium]|nr:hypothetical protein [Sporichthyaceae bacterium]